MTTERRRVLAYHHVPSADAFSRHLDWLVGTCEVVSLGQAISPERSRRGESVCSVTFDDGDPSVVDIALPLLQSRGITATLFVCPRFIGSCEPFWWEAVQAAVAAGLVGADTVTVLKASPDAERRSVVARLADELRERGMYPNRRQLTTDELLRWTDAGNEVGNHSWDHPCLDTCAQEEQERQIIEAHEWLTHYLGAAPLAFAYPNGDWTAHCDGVLSRLGYVTGLLFDHRLSEGAQDPLRLSRLRIDADAPVRRLQAVVSGAHPAAFAVARRAREVVTTAKRVAATSRLQGRRG